MHHAVHNAHRAGFAVPELATDSHGLAALGASGATPVDLSHPKKDEAPRLAGAEGFWNQENSNIGIVADIDIQSKAFLRLRARFEVAGFVLHDLADGSLLATGWNLCRPLPDATSALRFLRQIGGAA